MIAFDNQTIAQILAAFTVSEEPIWNQVLELIENDLETVSYVPFSNEISYRVTGWFLYF